MSTSLLCSRAYQITHAQTYVFLDSVLCVGKMGDDPIAVGKSKIKWYPENNHFKDMNRIDGIPTEFEWKIFPVIRTLGYSVNLSTSMTGTSSCQCTRILRGEKKEIQEDVNTTHRQLRIMLANSLAVIWSFLKLGSEKMVRNLH